MRAMGAVLCCVFAVAAAAKENKSASPAEQSGYVLLRVAKNTNALTRQARNFTFAWVASAPPEPKFHRLILLPGGDRTRTFAAWLPAGTYKLIGIRAEGLEGGSEAEMTLKAPPYMGTFEVRAGELTWLDTLMFQPLGDAQATWVHLESGLDPRSIMKEIVPVDLASLADKPFIRWVADKPWSLDAQTAIATTGGLLDLTAGHYEKQDRALAIEPFRKAATEADFLALMKKLPGQLNGGFIRADGTALFGSGMGQILKRPLSGKWTTLDTHCVCDVLSVAEAQDAIYAGTETGHILRSNDGGATFAAVAHAENGDGVVGIDLLSNGEWMVSTRRALGHDKFINYMQRRSFFLLADLAQLASAQPALSFESKYSDNFIKLGIDPPLSAGPIPHGFAVLEFPDKLHRYDADGRSWHESLLPKHVDRLSFTHSGSVLFSEDGGIKSVDGGVTWTKFDRVAVPIYQSSMYDAQAGVRIAAIPWTWVNAQVQFTDNGGIAWRKTSERGGLFCSGFGVNEVLHQVYCLGDGVVIRSSGNGATWSEEPME
jgi:hypothetical protein